ncbi:MAG: trehalose-6-phosphate synthase, partial [Candidatus Rokubacteria bacterium]|nr:trehalose-6-phosphate synthase [Candidatus Rokubacteria bacterium]
MRAGKTAPPPVSGQLFGSLASEFTELARSLDDARAAAEREALLRLEGEALWTAERLKQFVRSQLNDTPLFAVSNREPLIHQWRGRKIETVEPASGLVTALEPIMHACGGLWIAHGSGDADRETVDAQDKVGVPPEQPAYTLKRVWLTKEEEDGYYNGFANEGLWPLCHIAHTRPVFRASDWAAYRRVNEKFAEALLEEMEGTERPYVLIQDYHFALLPRLVKDRRPDARIVLFWHIPWPNPEAFGICPWQQEILLGMLGADLIGFHIQFHCNNFLETVDRTIEARVDRERFGVVRGRHTTYVKPFPISVAPAPDPADVG